MRSAVAVSVLLAVASWAGPAWSAGPSTLQEIAAAIERTATEPDGDRVVVGHISREVRIPAETLRAQRIRTGLNWGEILIANRLSRETGLALEQIVAEFRSGKRWEDIARDHKVDLGRLIADVRQSQAAVEQRAEDRPPRTDSKPVPDRPPAPTVRPGGGMGRGRY